MDINVSIGRRAEQHFNQKLEWKQCELNDKCLEKIE